MTTTDNTDLIYCVKCKQKTDNVDAERVDDEERPRHHQGDVRSLRNQEVPHRRIKKTAAGTGVSRPAAAAKQVLYGPQGVYHMTIINSSDIVNYCEACELEYVGHQCAPCPLSPLRARLEDAEHEITQSEPYRILDDVVRLEIQARINNLASFGWTLADFRVRHQEDRDHGHPVHIALLRRGDYDPDRLIDDN